MKRRAVALAGIGIGASSASMVSAAPPDDGGEGTAESAWETYVGENAATAAPGTLTCAVRDGSADDGAALVALCFALTAGADGAFDGVVIGRATSADGVTWTTFEPVSFAAGEPAAAVADPTGEGFPMPDAVGMDLQAAQDLLQEVAGNFLYSSSSEDATGEGRMQLIDSNWIVCSQNIQPGAIVTEDLNVIFSVVKDDETCP